MLKGSLYQPWVVTHNNDKGTYVQEYSPDWGFEIIDGEFSGTVVQIDKIYFIEAESSIGTDFHVINCREEFTKEELEKNTIFVNILETIILDIVQEAILLTEEVLNSEENKPNAINQQD